MMSLTFGLFTQVSGSGPLGPLVIKQSQIHVLYKWLFLPVKIFAIVIVTLIRVCTVCSNLSVSVS